MTMKVWEQPGELFLAVYQFHLQQNAGAYVPKQAIRAEVAADIRAIFNALDRKAAELFL